MRLAASNIGLPAYDHAKILPYLAELGLSGLEIAPSRIWADMSRGPSAAQVSAYRHAIESAGLVAVGLHSLFWQVPDLGLFREPDARARTIDFLVRLSALCRDLGGRTLVYGSAPARRRGSLSKRDAMIETVRFFGELCPRIERHGTCFCMEPLGPGESDFVNSAYESFEIVKAVDHPALRVQLDAKALVANGEAIPATFEAVAGYLVHFHANEPDLGVLGTSGTVDHRKMAEMLTTISYQGFVSVEQRMIHESSALDDLGQSTAVLRRHYKATVQ